jgi:hypothetical protein
MPKFPVAPLCSFCNLPVDLETSKTDEYGQAIHDECYVLKVRQKGIVPEIV